MIDHPLLGYRVWQSAKEFGVPFSARDAADPGALRGPYYSYIWMPEDNVASCHMQGVRASMSFMLYPTNPQKPQLPSHHPAGAACPCATCNCGFNGYHTLAKALERAKLVKPGDRIFGLVKGWGNSFLAPDGWRSEYAEIKALISFGQITPVLEAASRYYNAPIISDRSLDVVAQEFGRFVDPKFIPEKEV